MPHKMLLSALFLLLSGCAVYGGGYDRGYHNGHGYRYHDAYRRDYYPSPRYYYDDRRPRYYHPAPPRHVPAPPPSHHYGHQQHHRDGDKRHQQPRMTIAVTRSVRSIVAGRFNNVAGIQAAVPSYAFPMVASTTTSAVAGKIHDDLHAACPPLSCAYPS